MLNTITDNYLVNIIQEEYGRARRRAVAHGIETAIRRRPNRLFTLGEVYGRLNLDAEHYLGIRQVPVHRIVGSMARYQDFDGEFNPRHNNSRERWARVAAAHLQGVILPPVQLLKVGDGYFVRDGNHRVSVARHYGVESIDAEVIEYVTPCSLDKLAEVGPVRLATMLYQAREQMASAVARMFPRQEEQCCTCCE
jgi:hypothetical protein